MDKLRYRFLLTAICLPIIFLPHPSSALEENFQQYLKQQNETFATFLAEEEKDYAAFQAEIKKKWGEFVGSTR